VISNILSSKDVYRDFALGLSSAEETSSSPIPHLLVSYFILGQFDIQREALNALFSALNNPSLSSTLLQMTENKEFLNLLVICLKAADIELVSNCLRILRLLTFAIPSPLSKEALEYCIGNGMMDILDDMQVSF
jgi:hypothetical protein